MLCILTDRFAGRSPSAGRPLSLVDRFAGRRLGQLVGGGWR